jgi:prophage DNA circulation protein
VKSGDVSKASLQESADTVSVASATLREDLSELGRPPTPVAEDAKAAVDQLTTELEREAGKIEDAVSGTSGASEVLAAASEITASLAAMGHDLSSTVTQLESLQGESEWKQAFAESEACSELANR